MRPVLGREFGRESWFGILEALQNADFVLNAKGLQSAPARQNSAFSISSGGAPSSHSISGPAPGVNARHPLLSDLDAERVQNAIQRLFDASTNLEDSGFRECSVQAQLGDGWNAIGIWTGYVIWRFR